MTSRLTAPPARREGPPGPPRRATLSLLRMLFTDRLELMSSAAQRHGDAVRIAIGPKTMYLFNHPDYAKYVLADNSTNYHKGIGLAESRRALGDGLLTSEGELWRKQRKTIQPVFQHKRIARQAGIVADEAGKLVSRLKAYEHSGPVDVLEEMTELTLGVLGRTLLDADLGQFDAVGHSFEAVQDQAMFEAVTLNLVPSWLPLAKQRRFRAARDNLRGVADRLLAERRRDPVTGADDVLTRLLDSAAASSDRLTAGRQARDELITLLLAGHETTASTLGWAFAMADRHPEVWERLHAEAVEVLGDRSPEHADLHRLTYTTAVVEEVMRLYPPVWLLPRVAQEADVVGGYAVPAGADVIVCPYTMHRHPAFWDAPAEFDPGRFDPANSAGRPRYAYIPFGAGPRFCVGNSLGMLEAVFVLASVTRALKLVKTPRHRVVPEAMLSLRIRGGLPMSVHRA